MLFFTLLRYKRIVHKAGARYVGIQRCKVKELVLFDDPRTNTTLSIPTGQMSIQKVTQRLTASRFAYSR
jgi:hypothetical protein